jgi:hypothetical protein
VRELAVFETVQQLIKSYHVFYEVSPYHLVVEDGHGSPTATRRIIQVGFDVDVHGVSNKSELELPPPAEYALGYAELKKIAHTVSYQANECSIEVIPFPATVFSEAREQFRPEAVVRIRISHCRGVDQPSGLPEQNALKAVEEQLQALGVRRR